VDRAENREFNNLFAAATARKKRETVSLIAYFY
jgi:hypothetical protein